MEILIEQIIDFKYRDLSPLAVSVKWFKTRKNLHESDYVIVLEPGLYNLLAPCDLWKHAIVEKMLPGCDDLVRKVELRLLDKHKPARPIHKLCLTATAE